MYFILSIIIFFKIIIIIINYFMLWVKK